MPPQPVVMLDAARLASERRFDQAIEIALQYAEVSRGRGNRPAHFDALAAAGRFMHLADRHDDARRTLRSALDLLEEDLALQPSPILAMRRLNAWPELFPTAAISCLALHDPLGAIDFAERGRARAVAHRLGTAAALRPHAAAPERWDQYVALWRRAVADAANDLISPPGADHAARRRRMREDADALGEVRDALMADGVGGGDLAILGPPFAAAALPERLADCTCPTIVLYSMRLFERTLRLIAVDRHGAREMSLDASDQERVLSACDRHAAALVGGATADPDALDALLAEAGPPLGRVCASIAGDATPRLVWIAHSSLAAIPLAACPIEDGARVVAELAAVTVAPSLTLAHDILKPDRHGGSTAVAIAGRADIGQAPTAGARSVVALFDPLAPPDEPPREIEELHRVTRDAALVHLSCHGVARWNDPLRGYLAIGENFDLPLERLFDGSLDLDGKLLLLGVCDSASLAQGLTNEAIGVPIGLIASGARAVVGAAWEAPRIVAAAFCLRFVEALAEGVASPEATRIATLWLRTATYADLASCAGRAGHPLHDELAPILAGGMGEAPACPRPHSWSAFAHMGGGWRSARLDDRSGPRQNPPPEPPS